jgi:ectoine hydroxylase-related dioxygenase (phytanoyl-CoA dioxygenase family)
VSATSERQIVPTDSQRAELRRNGLLPVPGALEPALIERLAAALDRIYVEERVHGRVGNGEAMHLLGGIFRDDAFLDLLDHPAVFPVIWGELGWNIHMYHCHLDVTPPRASRRERPVWGWHQDGGRQNLELEGNPRPRLSLKVAYWLSDVSAPGRGSMLVVPGSHERNTLPRPEQAEGGFEQPTEAVPVLAAPGDALVFDRRLWHSRSDNLSGVDRKAIFLAYTYRWVRPRDHLGIDPEDARFSDLSPVRRQLLGEEAGPRSHWGLGDEAIPLRIELDRRGLLDSAIPAHR